MVAPPAPLFIPARHHGGRQTPKAIVIHGTVSPCDRGRARSIAQWWHGPSSPVTSAHYVRDPHESVQCVGDHTVAYHCGYNQDSIAYELCDPQAGPDSRWDDEDHRLMLDGAAEDIARLCLAYGIDMTKASVSDLKRRGPHGIYGHNDSRLAFGHTTHTDPGDAFPWGQFMRLVRKHANDLTHGTQTPTQEADMPYTDWPEKDRKALADDVADAITHRRLPNQEDAPKGRYVGATLTGIYNMLRDVHAAVVKPGK